MSWWQRLLLLLRPAAAPPGSPRIGPVVPGLRAPATGPIARLAPLVGGSVGSPRIGPVIPGPRTLATGPAAHLAPLEQRPLAGGPVARLMPAVAPGPTIAYVMAHYGQTIGGHTYNIFDLAKLAHEGFSPVGNAALASLGRRTLPRTQRAAGTHPDLPPYGLGV